MCGYALPVGVLCLPAETTNITSAHPPRQFPLPPDDKEVVMRTLAWLFVIIGIVLGNPFQSLSQWIFQHVTTVLVSHHVLVQAVDVFSLAVRLVVQ